MESSSVLGSYFKGWWIFLRAVLLIWLWGLVHVFPLYALALLELESYGEDYGTALKVARVLVIIVWLLWAPYVSLKIGMVRFEGGRRPEGSR